MPNTVTGLLLVPSGTILAVGCIVSGPGIQPGTTVTAVTTAYNPSNTLQQWLQVTLSTLPIVVGSGSTGVVNNGFNSSSSLTNLTLGYSSSIVFSCNQSAQYAVSGINEISGETLSFKEDSKGWVSFKSFIQENGISLNNAYYTFKDGDMYEHNVNATRNMFYGSQFDSSVDVVFNKVPGSIKSFSTLNYEGSQSRVTPEINDNPDYYDNFTKTGWYVESMISNSQELGEMEFWDKEDKWFGQIKGVKTEWLNDGTAGNIDPREFSYQGIGNADNISCPTCPPVNPAYECLPGSPATPGTPAVIGSNEIPGYYVGATTGTAGYWTLASSDCDPTQTFNSNVPTTSLTAVQIYTTSPSASGGGGDLDLSTLSFDIDDTYTDTFGSAPGADFEALYPTSTWCPGSTPNTSSAYLVDNWGSYLTSPPTYGAMGSAVVRVAYTEWTQGQASTPVNCPNAIGATPPGMNPNGYATYDDMLADSMIVFPGAGITMSTTPSQWQIAMIAHYQSWGPMYDSQWAVCMPWLQPCVCAGAWVPPVPATTGTWVPPVPAVTAVAAVPGTPAVIAGCYPAVGGPFPTLSDCNSACTQTSTPSWDCVANTCTDPGTGLGAFLTLFDCQSNCATPQSWDCVSGNCMDPGTGNGLYPSLANCQLNCAPAAIPGCTDSTACNYDPNATIDDGSCNEFAGGAAQWFNYSILPGSGSCNETVTYVTYWANVVSYLWSDGQTTPTATGFCPGDTGSVTATDNNGCTSTINFAIPI